MFTVNEISELLPYIAFGTLALILIVQLYYLLFVYAKLARYSLEKDAQEIGTPPLSVIISAYNEQENIRAYLPSILEQDYPEFEVIVVDDCSEDETKWILKELATTYNHLRIVEIKEHVKLKHIKKFALTIGIKAANYNHLVFTDADCETTSNQWLRVVASKFTPEKEIVLGYSPYFREKGLLNKLIRFETTHTAMSYLAYALKEDAYMGVGRNLAYTKDLFYKGKGFNAHMHIRSGDDDLFVNQNASRSNVAIAIASEAHMYSVPKSTWKSYYKQKGRHAGASILYKRRHKSMLATQLVSSVLFYCVLIACLIAYPIGWPYALGAYLLRLILQLIVYSNVYKKLGVKDLLVWLPVLDFIFYFYICINGLFNRTKKQTSWK